MFELDHLPPLHLQKDSVFCEVWEDVNKVEKSMNLSDSSVANSRDVQLESSRLRLRNYRLEDFDRVHIYGSQPEFSKYEIWGPNTEEDTKKFLERMVAQQQRNARYEFDLAICLKEKDLLVGGCGVRRESEGSSIANLGWAVNPDFQNQGIATEAAQILIEFAQETLKVKVIYATCDVRNVSSFKVMEKLGMKRVGRLPGAKLVKGRLRESFRYEKIL